MSSTSNSRPIVSLTLALAFLATLGACSGGESTPGGSGAAGGSGGSGGTSSTTGLPNPCTLVTSAELEAIVDAKIVRSEELYANTGDPSCTWHDDTYAVFQLGLWDDAVQYDYSKDQDNSVPLSGLGVEAHLGGGYAVHVLTKKGDAFFAQSLNDAADGKLSPEIQAAVSADMMPYALQYEAAFRLAKLVVNDL